MNPFIHGTAARRYAQARPYYHPVVMALMRKFLPVEWPVGRVLDVACGTGQSCVALWGLAGEIVGIDSSAEMLAEAARDSLARYLRGAAEALPFRDGCFDLVTVSSAFHWLERERYLREANRVLAAGGWLVVYGNGFKGEMQGNAAFREWYFSTYLARYPGPPRHGAALTVEEAESAGFRFARNESYGNEVAFNVEGLCRYLTTQSNIIAAVEEGRESFEEVCGWLLGSLGPLFGREVEVFGFGGAVWCLEKMGERDC